MAVEDHTTNCESILSTDTNPSVSHWTRLSLA